MFKLGLSMLDFIGTGQTFFTMFMTDGHSEDKVFMSKQLFPQATKIGQ